MTAPDRAHVEAPEQAPDQASVARLVVEPDVDAAAGVGGVVWKLPHDGDLDGNLVRLASGRSIEQHVNDEVDVLVIVRAGGGRLVVDGEPHPLGETTVALIPRGALRSLTAGDDGIAYLSIHRRRSGLSVGRAADRHEETVGG